MKGLVSADPSYPDANEKLHLRDIASALYGLIVRSVSIRLKCPQVGFVWTSKLCVKSDGKIRKPDLGAGYLAASITNDRYFVRAAAFTSRGFHAASARAPAGSFPERARRRHLSGTVR